MKTKASLTAIMAEGNTFALPAHIWLVFPTIIKQHILIKIADVITPDVFASSQIADKPFSIFKKFQMDDR